MQKGAGSSGQIHEPHSGGIPYQDTRQQQSLYGFFVVPASMKAIAAYIFGCRVFLVLRASAITEPAPPVFGGRSRFVNPGHINGADFYKGH